MKELLEAVVADDITRVQELAQHCADIELEEALREAALRGRLKVVKYLVEQCHVHVNATTEQCGFITPLMFATRNGSIDVVRYLAGHCGVDVNATDKDGNTALIVIGSKRYEITQYLVEECSAVANVKNQDGVTALMEAARLSNFDAVKYLVQECDVNAMNDKGETALLLAADLGIEIVRYLAEQCGADANAKTKKGETTLMYAINYGKIELIRYLVEDCGVDVNAKTTDGDTALIRATKRGKIKLVKYFVEQCGADVNATTTKGKTAIRIAADRGHHEIQRILTPFVSTALQANSNTVADKLVYSSRFASNCAIPPSEIELILFDRNGNIGDFRAKWLDADAVVKLYIPDASHSPFKEEVRLWQKLRHPNVIKMYGACVGGPNLRFFICEFASQGSLLELVKSSQVEKRFMWKYLHEAALGLEYLHERGIVHGDLRCSNILIGSDGVAKLSNFGLSGLTKSNSVSSSVAGSMRWQSPEVLEGNSMSYESDVYSLGMCIFEGTTGETLWGWEYDGMAIYSKGCWAPETDPSSIDGPGVAPIGDARELFWSMCSQDPHKRASLSSVVYKLERLAMEECSDVSQPENEPSVSFDEYELGNLQEVWLKLQTYMKKCRSGEHVQAFNDIKNVCEQLQVSMQPATVFAQFYTFLTEFYQMIKMNSEQVRMLRLSSTRATTTSLYAFQWRLKLLIASLGESAEASAEREARWQQQRVDQIEFFIAGVADAFLVLQDLKSAEEQSAFLRTLKTEMKAPQGKYTPDQLAKMKETYDEIASKLETDDPSELTPEWFIPWYELVVDEWGMLGEGGFGSVYRAKWLDSEVVVKRLSLADSSDTSDTSTFDSLSILSASVDPSASGAAINSAKKKEALTMFRREVDIWFGFSHPHVIQLFGACHVGIPFFVCEYASNGTLVSYLQKYPDQLWSKLHEAALGVQYLHARNVVHGDLKGNNIMIGGDMKAKVTDFGLSSIASSEVTPAISAAWNWVAPECFPDLKANDSNTRPTFASDVYSLGMCIIEALRVVDAVRSGKGSQTCLPWSIRDVNAVKYHALHGKLPSRPTNCENSQWELIKRMCVLNPKERVKISSVVDELARLANVNTDKRMNELPNNLLTLDVEQKPFTDIISAARKLLAGGKDGSYQLDAVLPLYVSLWDNLEAVAGQIDGNRSARCCIEFCRLLSDANVTTTKLQDTAQNVISYAEMTLGYYALDRRLNKLCEAYSIVRVKKTVDTDARRSSLKTL